MKPRMNNKEIQAFKQELLKRKNKSQIDVLEWGSGGSTVYFTRFLKQQEIPYSWASIEYNKLWFEKIQKEVAQDSNTSLVLFDVGNTNLKQRFTNMDQYVHYPTTLNKKFDIIFVDGRKRRRCVLLAKQLLKEGGVVMLHDARRHYYRCAQKEYKNSCFVSPEFWKGSLEPMNGLQLFSQKLKNFWYSFLFWGYVFPWRFLRNHIKSKWSSTQKILTLVSGCASKIKVLFLVVLFTLKKRGISLGNYNISINTKKHVVVVVNTKGIRNIGELFELLQS